VISDFLKGQDGELVDNVEAKGLPTAERKSNILITTLITLD